MTTTTTTTTPHDATRGDLCGCTRCDAKKLASLAVSRALVATQAALWHPRSQKLAAVRRQATADAASAIANLAAAAK